MKYIVKVLITLVLSNTPPSEAGESRAFIDVGTVDGDEVQVVLGEETMRNTPSWDGGGTSAVPLAPNVAVAAAIAYLDKVMVQKPYGGLLVNEVSLKRYSEHRFYYIVCFERDFQPTGLHRDIKVVVTLDGAPVPFQKKEK